MAAPDVREENLSVKVFILAIAVARLHAAIEYFARGVVLEVDAESVVHFERELALEYTAATDAIWKGAGPLPITLRGSKFEREWVKDKYK